MIKPEEVERWLVKRISHIFGLSEKEVHGSTAFDDLGMDSVTRAGLTREIEERFGHPLDPEALYEYPTPRAIAEHIGSG
jgi:acyl carrier protein